MADIRFIKEIRDKAKKRNLRVAFPDAEDERTLNASVILKNEGIAVPVLVGNEEAIKRVAADKNISLEGIEIVDPAKSEDNVKDFTARLYEKRKHKGMTEDEARKNVLDPLFFAGFMLELEMVQVVVGGNVSSTGNVMRASIFTVGVAPNISIVSSYFIMVMPDERMYCFADCAVNPNPSEAQLADIAISSAKNFESVTGQEGKIAMLSFSTNGSADTPEVEKVRNATKIVREKAPDLLVDGEMQFDAAIIPSIGERKFPGSKVAGQANVMVFPDLNAGNIGYKMVQRLAGAEAVGPIVQGLNKPYCDLSRGCSVDDMVNVAAICSLMA